MWVSIVFSVYFFYFFCVFFVLVYSKLIVELCPCGKWIQFPFFPLLLWASFEKVRHQFYQFDLIKFMIDLSFTDSYRLQ